MNEVPFLDWVDCYRDSYDREECGDLSGLYYRCYMRDKCEGIVDSFWYDCFWGDIGCAAYRKDLAHDG